MSFLHYFVILAVLGSAFAISGRYIPRAFYHLDEAGHKSDVVYLSKRDLSRFKRSDAGFGGSIAYDGPSAIAGTIDAGLRHIQSQVEGLASRSNFAGGSGGGGASGGHSFSGSFSSGGGTGPGTGGATLHSRFASDGSGYEKEYVAGGPGGISGHASASGPNGAFSYSSSSVDGNGRVQYSSQARKF